MSGLLVFFAAASFLLMTGLWWRQRFTKNATSVDVAWSLGIAVETAILAWASDGDVLRRMVVCVLVSAWAIRLSSHLYFDRVVTGIEDGRYARFRREWSQTAFFGLYMAQAALVFLLPLTFLAAFKNPNPFPGALDILALILWAIAVGGEATADRQLARFRANPANKGRTCREGLWKYSRHPNYFFEWLIWCAYIPMAIGSSSSVLVSLMGPALLLFLLLKVSGIPPTEAQAVASRGDDYRQYQKTTSAFFPWFPKDTKS